MITIRWDQENCTYYLQEKRKTHRVVIISGHAIGADTLGERFATENNLDCELYPADWKSHGRAAGPIRNKKMAEVVDALIAFWNGESKGSVKMIKLAKEHGLKNSRSKIRLTKRERPTKVRISDHTIIFKSVLNT